MSNRRFLNLKGLGIFCVCLTLSLVNLHAADSNAPANIGSAPQDVAGSNDTLRAYLQLQEQLHATQLALDRNRQEAEAAAAQNSAALSNRLQAIEQSLAAQRASELETARRTNHLLLTIVSIFAVIGFAAALFTAYFQWRAVSRLADISTALSTNRSLTFPATAALGLGEHEAISHTPVEQSNARLLALVQQLEKRIAELEMTATLPLKQVASAENGHAQSLPQASIAPPADDKAEQLADLLRRAQVLLDDRPEEALVLFDEILALAPNNVEALVKKGTALEKMRQPQEALECYDRAIAADNSLTIAYLHKGGLCSRMEKYGEAMECYERALHTQEKKRAA